MNRVATSMFKALDAMADVLHRRLQKHPRLTRITTQLMANPIYPASTDQPNNPFALLFALGILGAALLFFGQRFSSYSAWPPAIYKDQRVFNLTDEQVVWDMHYGDSKKCGLLDCHLTALYNRDQFERSVVLPLKEFPLRDYKNGQAIYLRSQIKVPERLRLSNEPLALHTILVFAQQYQVYVNERLLYEGVKETMLVSIPREYIRDDGNLFVSIKLIPGDLQFQGIANRGDLVLGPRAALADLSFYARDVSSSMILMYILPKIAFCVVFALIFFFVRQAQEIPWFLLYGCLSVMEQYLRSDFSQTLPLGGTDRELLALLCRNGSFLAFGRFVLAFFRVQWSGLNRGFVLALTALVVSTGVARVSFGYQFATSLQDALAVALKPIVMGSSLCTGMLMAGQLAQSPKSRWRSRVALAFVGIVALGFGPMMIDVARVVGDLFSAGLRLPILNFTWVFDLVLFVFMSSLVGLDMALRAVQQKATTLELAAMSERMELAGSIQVNLLPTPMNGEIHGYRYYCRYKPADRLAGDWLYVGGHENATARFYLGDVTGKGPAASIAMAAIVSLMRKKDFEPASLEDVLKELNKHLGYLFRGQLGSALNVLETHADGRCRIATFGALGWVKVAADGQIELIQGRGAILGLQASIGVQLIEFEMLPGDRVFAFSDGCLEGVRTLKKLHDALKHNKEISEADHIFSLVCKVGEATAAPDDKTFLMIERLVA